MHRHLREIWRNGQVLDSTLSSCTFNPSIRQFIYFFPSPTSVLLLLLLLHLETEMKAGQCRPRRTALRQCLEYFVSYPSSGDVMKSSISTPSRIIHPLFLFFFMSVLVGPRRSDDWVGGEGREAVASYGMRVFFLTGTRGEIPATDGHVPVALKNSLL